ncbi:MAG TPA: hypothetical protein VGX94_13050 [Terriglobia bacterium]|nr:hypothetical protein [Terriglobia bacterium]
MNTNKFCLAGHNYPLRPEVQRGDVMRRLRLNRPLAGNVAGRTNWTVRRRRRLALLQNRSERMTGTRENKGFAMMVKADYEKQVQLREDRHCDGGGESRSMSTVLGRVSQLFRLPMRSVSVKHPFAWKAKQGS